MRWSTGLEAPIGGAVARAYAVDGAGLFLTGRNLAPVEVVAKDVVAAGGSAEAAEVDAVAEQAVDEHLQSVIETAGRIDISFDAVGIPGTKTYGVPLVELDVKQFSLPVTTNVTSYFLTARLAARHMIPKKSGVIMTATTLHARTGLPSGGRLRPSERRQGGTHPTALRRARTSRHSRRRCATTGHARDRHDQGSLRGSPSRPRE